MLLRTARVVAGLREALSAGDLDRLTSVLDGAKRQRLADVAQPELVALLAEVGQRRADSALRAALKRGGPTGSPGRLDIGEVTVADLEKAIAEAESNAADQTPGRRQSHQSAALLASARVVRAVRAGLLAAGVDWRLVRGGLEAAATTDLAPEAEAELDLVRADVIVRGVAQELRAALRSRGVECVFSGGRRYNLGTRRPAGRPGAPRSSSSRVPAEPDEVAMAASEVRGGRARLAPERATTDDLHEALAAAGEAEVDPTVVAACPPVAGRDSPARGAAVADLPEELGLLRRSATCLAAVRAAAAAGEWDAAEVAFLRLAVASGVPVLRCSAADSDAALRRALEEAVEAAAAGLGHSPLAGPSVPGASDSSGTPLLAAVQAVRGALAMPSASRRAGTASPPAVAPEAAPELAAVWEALALRREREAAAGRAAAAVEGGDAVDAGRAIEAALEAGCDRESSSGVPDAAPAILARARETLGARHRAGARLERASAHGGDAELRVALQLARSRGLRGQLVDAAEERLQRSEGAAQRATAALASMDEEAIEQALRSEEALPSGMRAALREALALPLRERLSRRLVGAVRSGDAAAGAAATLQLRRLELRSHGAPIALRAASAASQSEPGGSLEAVSGQGTESPLLRRGRYSLLGFAGMRRAREFAKAMAARRRKLLARQSARGAETADDLDDELPPDDVAAEAQTRWTGSTLPTSVTALPARDVPTAVALSRNVLSFAGDYAAGGASSLHASPATAATEVLGLVAAKPGLRDEVLCQLLRHLASNPRPASRQMGWALLWLCLAQFVPSDGLQDIVEVALRRCIPDAGAALEAAVSQLATPHDVAASSLACGPGEAGAAASCLLAMHVRAFGHGAPVPVAEEGVARLLQSFAEHRSWSAADRQTNLARTSQPREPAEVAPGRPGRGQEAPRGAREAASSHAAGTAATAGRGAALSLAEMEARASRLLA